MSTAEAGQANAGQDRTWRGLSGEQPEDEDQGRPKGDTEHEREQETASAAVHRLAVLGSIALVQVVWLGSLAYFGHRLLT